MEQFLRTLALVPLIVAITQGVKSIVPESFYKFLWMFSCGLGVLVAFGYVYALNIVEYNDVMIIMAGVIAGLSASGLYEVSKNTVRIFNPKSV